jgi:hypothetical protein
MLLGSRGLVKFINKECATISDSDEASQSQRMSYAMLIKGSIYHKLAIGLKGVKEMICLL